MSNVLCFFQTLQAQVAGASATSASAATATDIGKSVIDLTDDDDMNLNLQAPKQPMQAPQLLLISTPQQQMNIPTAATLASTAVVKPMRPLPPPPLQIAPKQQAVLQVLSCQKLICILLSNSQSKH